MEAKVSVIVPVYNLEDYIDRCIESIIKQTYTNLEIILVNDGSVDDSLNKCYELAQKDNRICVINQSNGGVSSARNSGLEKASGKYITFVDGDDVISPNMISLLINQFNSDEIQLSCCRTKKINVYDCEFPEKNIIFSQSKVDDCYKRLLLEKFDMSACGKLYSKSVIGDIRFEVGKKINEDKFFLFEYLFYSEGSVAYTNEQLYGYYEREDSVTNEKFSVKYLDAAYFSARIVELCETKDEYTKELAIYNLMSSRFMILKKMVRTNSVAENSNLFKRIKREILTVGLPKNISMRAIKKLEFYALKISSKLYITLVRIVDRIKYH